MSQEVPRVVIIGGGFGGINAARWLRRAPVDVTVVDQRNHHVFQPLLYQVATAGLNPSDIATPIRHILRKQKNTNVVLAQVTAVDLVGKVVQLEDETIAYDYLILAAGASHSYFGHPEWEPFAPGLKNIDDALEIRRRVLTAFESAERETDAVKHRAWLTFVVVGGGPTGVELSGSLCDIARYALASDFRQIDPTQAQVILLEASDRILAAYVPELSQSALMQLQRLGTDVRTHQMVTKIDADGVSIGPETIPTKTVLWAAGVAASPLARSLGVPLDKAGRVLVDQDLSIAGHPEVYVVGDLASLKQDGVLIPGVAPAAIQEARHAAQNIIRRIQGETTLPFRYRNKGELATIGRLSAIADLGWVKLTGMTAWLAWLLIHVMFLIGFRNRFIVVFQWAWSFITFQRGARLITGPINSSGRQKSTD